MARFAIGWLGLAIGMIYGLLAVGLVLVHRMTRVINFAHASVGLVAASVLGLVVVRWQIPFYVALVPALLIGAGISALVYLGAIRRLEGAPVLMKVVATIGVAAFLQIFAVGLNEQVSAGRLFPQPPWVPEFFIGPLLVTRSYAAMLIVGPLVVIGLSLYLARGRLGIALRGSAANAELARLDGMSAVRMTSLAWAFAGALSAFTAILVLPTQGGFGGAQNAFGPQLMVRALAAAVFARMQSLPMALGAGLIVGVVEQQLLFNSTRAGLVDVVLLGMLVVSLLIQRRSITGRDAEDGRQWLVVQSWPPVSPSAPWPVRKLGRIVAAVALVGAIVLPLFVSSGTTVILVAIMTFGIIGLSVGLISGLAGQISLGQFAIAATGGVMAWFVLSWTNNFTVALAAAAAAGAATSVLLGIPAVRIRGLMFAVATLGFALATPWLLQQDWLLGEGRITLRPAIGSFTFDSTKRYYFVVLFFLALSVLLAHRVWASGVGRRYRALRDNQEHARAFGVPPTRVQLEAFAIAGCLAGLGGALYAHSLSAISAEAFPTLASTNIVAMTALGGVGMMAGPLLGALYIVGVPRWIPLDNAGLAATALGWLILILYLPGGLAQVIAPIRARFIEALTRRFPSRGDEESAAEDSVSASMKSALSGRSAESRRERRGGGPVLQVSKLSKHYGGVVAVNDVSIEVPEGQTLGVIGANGAGKTTLFELIGGFNRPDSGRVVFAGEDVTRTSADLRARKGLVRSFQDARLFATLTVTETIQVALERTMPTRAALEIAALTRTEGARRRRAAELIDVMGLGPHAQKQIAELSTGTRRVVELSCVLALEPRVVLLDEPSSGIAQKETEGLGELLVRVKKYLDATILIVEHDIPLVSSISDRIIAMATGAVIADGKPAAVLRDRGVVEAYLGADKLAIERSGPAPAGAKKRCQAQTQSGAACSRNAVSGGLCAQHLALQEARV